MIVTDWVTYLLSVYYIIIIIIIIIIIVIIIIIIIIIIIFPSLWSIEADRSLTGLITLIIDNCCRD